MQVSARAVQKLPAIEQRFGVSEVARLGYNGQLPAPILGN
jgi:hypothetical protein